MKKCDLLEIALFAIIIALCCFVVLASIAAYQDTRSNIEWRKATIEAMKERSSE